MRVKKYIDRDEHVDKKDGDKDKCVQNSNLDKYDIDKDKHVDKKNGGKDKCVNSIDILLAAETSSNAHEDLKISFEDSHDDYDDESH